MKTVLAILFGSILLSLSCLAQPQNIQVNNPTASYPEEVSIAVNPADPHNVVAGSNLNYAYSSHDGGRTWGTGTLRSAMFGVWGDPSVIFDADGNAYYGHLSNPPSPGYWIDRIVVQKSTDGGAYWDDGVGIGWQPGG